MANPRATRNMFPAGRHGADASAYKNTKRKRRTSDTGRSGRYSSRLVVKSSYSIYSELDPRKRQIRLLELLPASSGKSPTPYLDCRLTTVSLDDGIEFDALSYVSIFLHRRS